MIANSIGAVLFVLAMAALYAAPFFALRRDRRFWRALRQLDPTPIQKGLREEHGHSRCSQGIGLAELSPDGLDSYGRVPLTAAAGTSAALRSDGGSLTSTEGTG